MHRKKPERVVEYSFRLFLFSFVLFLISGKIRGTFRGTFIDYFIKLCDYNLINKRQKIYKKSRC